MRRSRSVKRPKRVSRRRRNTGRTVSRRRNRQRNRQSKRLRQSKRVSRRKSSRNRKSRNTRKRNTRKRNTRKRNNRKSNRKIKRRFKGGEYLHWLDSKDFRSEVITALNKEIGYSNHITGLSKLGHGGMGAVFKTSINGKEYAVKVLAHKCSIRRRSSNELKSVLSGSITEDSVLRKLKRVPYFYEVIRCVRSRCDHNYLCSIILSEFYEGITLSKYAMLASLQYTTDYKQIADIMGGLVTGLKELHKHSVLHLDLKEENIMLRDNGDGTWEPFIVDFDHSLIYEKIIDVYGEYCTGYVRDNFSIALQYLRRWSAPHYEKYVDYGRKTLGFTTPSGVVSHIHHTFDIYSLGSIFLNLLTTEKCPKGLMYYQMQARYLIGNHPRLTLKGKDLRQDLTYMRSFAFATLPDLIDADMVGREKYDLTSCEFYKSSDVNIQKLFTVSLEMTKFDAVARPTLTNIQIAIREASSAIEGSLSEPPVVVSDLDQKTAEMLEQSVATQTVLDKTLSVLDEEGEAASLAAEAAAEAAAGAAAEEEAARLAAAAAAVEEEEEATRLAAAAAAAAAAAEAEEAAAAAAAAEEEQKEVERKTKFILFKHDAETMYQDLVSLDQEIQSVLQSKISLTPDQKGTLSETSDSCKALMENCNSHNEELWSEGTDYEAIITEYTRKIEDMRDELYEHKKQIETLKLEEEAEAARLAVEAEAEYMELEEAINEHRALKELQKLHYENKSDPMPSSQVKYTQAKDTYMSKYLTGQKAKDEMAELEKTFEDEYHITSAVEKEKFIHNFCVVLALRTYTRGKLNQDFVEEESSLRDDVRGMIEEKFQELQGDVEDMAVFRGENKELIKSVKCRDEATKLFKEAKLLAQLIVEDEEVAEDGFREVETKLEKTGFYKKITGSQPLPIINLKTGTNIFVKYFNDDWMECKSDELDEKKGPWYVKTVDITPT